VDHLLPVFLPYRLPLAQVSLYIVSCHGSIGQPVSSFVVI